MAVQAPFRFAPIHRRVWFPDWGPLVSHDVPFADGLSGEIPIEIIAETPLLVGGPRRKARHDLAGEVWPVETIDRDGRRRYAIPDSSLQGLVRSILEIAAFGKLGPWIDERRYGIRDLVREAEPFYQRRLNQVSGGSPIRVDPRVCAGWLRRTADGYELQRCSFARIEFSELTALTGVPGGPVPPRGDPTYAAAVAWGKASDSATRYGWVGAASLRCTLQVENAPPQPRHLHGPAHRRLSIAYRKAHRTGGAPIPSTTLHSGNIVLTGNTSDPRPHSKHMEFFFFDVQPAIRLEDAFAAKFKEFEALHAPDDGRRVNANWVFYNELGYPGNAPFRDGGRMPIFYLLDTAGGVESFGLAFMFKLAHRRTTHELLANSTPDHLDKTRLDLASLIFGAVADRDAGTGLKRRASFDLALGTLPANGNVRATPSPTVLLGPKPSYYPIYIRQPVGAAPGELPHYPDPASGENRRLPYATFTPLDGTLFQPAAQLKDEHKFPELAGVKIWPTRRQCSFPNLPPAPHGSNPELQGWLWALPRGTRFRTILRFHNLRPVELGAVLWALTFGQTNAAAGQATAFRHRIGMGKPYAMGEISIRVRDGTIIPNQGSAPGIAGLIGAFNTEMDRVSTKLGLNGPWSSSAQVKALLRAATGIAGGPGAAYQYMQLGQGPHPDPGTYRHEKSAGHFLPIYGDGTELEFPRAAPPSASPVAPAHTTAPAPPGAAADTFPVGTRVVDTRWDDEGIVMDGVDGDGKIAVRFGASVSRVPVTRLRKPDG
ncbi:MAG: TIGR03986 family type III CRISPR-associated RAMP protein [Stellaceae bacterium]